MGNGSRSLLDLLGQGERADFPSVWLRRLLTLLQKRGGEQPAPRRLKPFPALRPPHIIIISAPPAPALPTQRCAPASPIHRAPRPILCVDGTSGTPPSTSEEEGTTAPSHAVSPLKRLLHSRPPAFKSPMKAASERILKKYSISPRKRPLRPIRRRPPAVGSGLGLLPQGGGGVQEQGAIQDTVEALPAPASPPAAEEGGQDMVDSADTPTTLARRKSRALRCRTRRRRAYCLSSPLF